MKAKKDVANERREKQKTGGGPQGGSLDSLSEKVMQLLPHAEVHSLANPFDDDASLFKDDVVDDNLENVVRIYID